MVSVHVRVTRRHRVARLHIAEGCPWLGPSLSRTAYTVAFLFYNTLFSTVFFPIRFTMHTQTLSLALAAVGAANAILIPPSVSAAELDLGDDMAMEIVANSYPRTVSLDCATCEVATSAPDGSIAWTQRNGNTFV